MFIYLCVVFLVDLCCNWISVALVVCSVVLRNNVLLVVLLLGYGCFIGVACNVTIVLSYS